MKKRFVRKGEALAIMSEALHRGPTAQWWDELIAVPGNERHGTVAVVHVRGSLDHHVGFGCDSYDAIVDRAEMAFAGEGEEDEGAPSAVVLRIDSPGGVVSGLNEAVFALRRMSKEYGVPLIAFVDELAASAAYALACACDEIYLPASAIAGSIGVISTLFDQTKADEDMGVKFVTLTSGARKADGHPHVPISDAALSAEQKRVDRLAKQFFRLVASKRPVSVDEVAGYQAGIFLGNEAVSAGLADDVMGWDEFISTLNDAPRQKSIAKLSISVSTSKTPAQAGTTSKRSNMSQVGLKALVRKTAEAVANEADPKKKAALTAALSSYEASLEAYKKTKHSIEKHETEEGEDDDEDEAPEESEEASEDAKGNEEKKSKKAAKASDDDSDEDDSDDESDDDEEEASAKKAARAALGSGPAARRAMGQLTAVFAKAKKFDELNADVGQLKRDALTAKKNALIDEAVAQRRIPRHMAAKLRGKKLDFVTGTLEMHKSPMVHLDEEVAHVPDGTPNADLSKDVIRAIDQAVTASNKTPDEQAKFRTALIEAHRARQAQANGAGERY